MTWIGLSVTEYYALVGVLAGSSSLNFKSMDEGTP